MATLKAEKGSLEAVFAEANKKYNVSVGPIDSIIEDVERFSCGNLAIDHILGGGIPLGRSVELFGPPSCGKTTLAIMAAAQLQQIIIAGGDPKRGIHADDKILYLDYEQAIDPDYVKALGLDPNHESFWIAQPDTLEDGANFTLAAVATGRIRLIIVDSVASMLPSAIDAAEVGKSLPAVQAKLLSTFTQKMNPLLANNNASILYLNHLVEVMDMGMARRPGMPPRTSTPGGKAIKYYSSVRVEFKQIGNIKEATEDPITKEKVEQVMATNVLVKTVKNKTFPPFRQAVVRVRFGTGFDNFWTALQILVANKKIIYGAGIYKFHHLDEFGLAPEWMSRAQTGAKAPYVKGDKAIFKVSEEHPEWREALIAYAGTEVLNNKKVLDSITPQAEEESEDEEESLEDILA